MNSVKKELGRDSLATLFAGFPSLQWSDGSPALCSHLRDMQKDSQGFSCFPFSSLRPPRAHLEGPYTRVFLLSTFFQPAFCLGSQFPWTTVRAPSPLAGWVWPMGGAGGGLDEEEVEMKLSCCLPALLPTSLRSWQWRHLAIPALVGSPPSLTPAPTVSITKFLGAQRTSCCYQSLGTWHLLSVPFTLHTPL